MALRRDGLLRGRFSITASTNGRGRVIAGSGRSPRPAAGLHVGPHEDSSSTTHSKSQPAEYRPRQCRFRLLPIACIAAPSKKNKQLCAAGCMSQKKLGTSEGPVPSPGCMQAPGRCGSPLPPPSSRPGTGPPTPHVNNHRRTWRRDPSCTPSPKPRAITTMNSPSKELDLLGHRCTDRQVFPSFSL